MSLCSAPPSRCAGRLLAATGLAGALVSVLFVVRAVHETRDIELEQMQGIARPG